MPLNRRSDSIYPLICHRPSSQVVGLCRDYSVIVVFERGIVREPSMSL